MEIIGGEWFFKIWLSGGMGEGHGDFQEGTSYEATGDLRLVNNWQIGSD